MYRFCFCVYVCIYYNVVCMFLCGGTPCTGFAFCATPSLCDKLDNNNNNNNNNLPCRQSLKTYFIKVIYYILLFTFHKSNALQSHIT